MILDELWITSPLTVGGIVFVFVAGGAMLGVLLRAYLPEHHLSAESKDVVRLGIGLLATMSALVLGLLIASAKTSYEAQRTDIAQMASKIILLDRILIHYGAETRQAREGLQASTAAALDRMWPSDRSRPVQLAPTAGEERIYDEILALRPVDDAQRQLRAEALRLSAEIGRTRWLLLEQQGLTIPAPFLLLLTFWLATIFMGFGLFAPANPTVIGTLTVCALSIAGAIFVILELDRPFGGLIRISSAPLREALAQLGR